MPMLTHFPNRFADQVALVTGGADGLGKAIARRLVAEGASIALLDHNSALLDRTVQELIDSGGSVRGYTVDGSPRPAGRSGRYGLLYRIAGEQFFNRLYLRYFGRPGHLLT